MYSIVFAARKSINIIYYWPLKRCHGTRATHKSFTKTTESYSLWSDKIYKGKSVQFLASNALCNVTLIIPQVKKSCLLTASSAPVRGFSLVREGEGEPDLAGEQHHECLTIMWMWHYAAGCHCLKPADLVSVLAPAPACVPSTTLGEPERGPPFWCAVGGLSELSLAVVQGEESS